MDKIFIFETRKSDYLNSYANKAKKLGYELIVLSNKSLEGSKKFETFKSIYQHLSYNSISFEVNCFARYFAFAREISFNESFILSDSDIYLTSRKIQLKDDSSFNNVFIGSEGFDNLGSEQQISPHFSIWNRELINNFIDYIIDVYTKNLQDGCLTKHYELQKKRLGRTSISDMTLLYMWVREKKIPYINSNKTESNFGFDHNISTLICEDNSYKSFQQRKVIEYSNVILGDLNFILETGNKQEVSCIHFQGGYKQILNDFYLGNFKKFYFFSIYINWGRKVTRLINS